MWPPNLLVGWLTYLVGKHRRTGENFFGGRGRTIRKMLLYENLLMIRSTIEKNVTLILKTVVFLDLSV